MDKKTFYKFVSPSLVVMGSLMVFPLAMAIWLGMNFITYRNLNAPAFVGLANYADVLTDPKFWQAFWFTIRYIITIVPTTIVIGFFLAVFLDQTRQITRSFFISSYLLPMVIVPVVGTLMFKSLFEPSGLATWVIREVFNQRFIFSENTVKALIYLNSIWGTTAFPFIVLYAGLLTLPKEQIEAAIVDGATRWQQIRYILVPHLSSLLVFLGLIQIMDAYRIFDSVFVMTEQNPVYNAESIMVYTFRTAMTVHRLGKANAMAVITVVMILVVLIPLLVQTYREQTMER